MTIGEKCRALRVKRGLTQRETCGNYMTRNMLSAIENGAATPSVDTIRYLADRFDIDAGYFLSEADDPSPFIKLKHIAKITSALKKGDYSLCLSLEHEFENPDSEISFYMFSAYLIAGREELRKGLYKSASERFRRAREYCAWTMNADTLNEIAGYYYELCRSETSESAAEPPAPHGNGYLTEIYERSLYELIMRLLDRGENEAAAQVYDVSRLQSAFYRLHINARLSVASGNFQRAYDLLTGITRDSEVKNADAGFLYSVYTDLEFCCKAIGDFKGAYDCVVARSEIEKNTEI